MPVPLENAGQRADPAFPRQSDVPADEPSPCSTVHSQTARNA
jgi:hypothetical protein